MKKQKRLSMRKIREILRLHYECHLSYRAIKTSVKASISRCYDYVQIFEEKGLSWPLSEEYTDEVLEEIFRPKKQHKNKKAIPDWPVIHIDNKKKGMTLFLLWQEYREINPDGYGYTNFCSYYKKYVKTQEYSLRQVHKGGDKLFVDYTGHKVPIHNLNSTDIKYVEIFVGCLGASQYTYAEATWTQQLDDWISSHINAFEFFKGVPQCVVPDNLKSGVSKACRYDPDVNPTYQELAKHYGTAIVPTRSGKPKDKSKVESSVYLVERWILAALRNYKFFTITSLNQKIKELLFKLNRRDFKKMSGNRYQLYEEVDLPALQPLPEKRYELCRWLINKTVHVDYHVEIEQHYYSVPYTHVGKKIDVRLTSKMVEFFFNGSRIASHIRNRKKWHHSTIEAHRPKSHQEYLKWTPARILNWAEKTGENCKKLAAKVMKSRSYPEQGFRTILGILRLSKTHSAEELEKACQIALTLKSYRYSTVKNILQNKANIFNREIKKQNPFVITKHENIRGETYYQSKEDKYAYRTNFDEDGAVKTIWND